MLQLLIDSPGSASIATVVRVVYGKELTENNDFLYNFYDLALWSTVECGMALLASSLATLKPLFRRMNMIFTTTRQSSSRGTGTRPTAAPHPTHPEEELSAVHRTKSNTSFSTYSPRNTSVPNIRPEERTLAGHRTHSSFSSTYGPRKMSLSKVDKVSISVPQAVRWNYRIESDEIAMIPRSPASDVQSAVSSKPSFNKMWDDDMV